MEGGGRSQALPEFHDSTDSTDLDTAIRYDGNDRDRIFASYGPLHEDATIASLDVPFRLSDRAGVIGGSEGSGHLTIFEGNTFEFAEGGLLEVNDNGTLTAPGTSRRERESGCRARRSSSSVSGEPSGTTPLRCSGSVRWWRRFPSPGR